MWYRIRYGDGSETIQGQVESLDDSRYFLKKVGLRLTDFLVSGRTCARLIYDRASDASSILRPVVHGDHLLGRFGSPT